MNKKQKGSIIELRCIERFLQYGFGVSIPYGDCSRYDFIVDFNGILKRFQCKSGLLDNDILTLYTSSSHITGSGVEKKLYSSSDVDYFCTCFSGVLYVIPIEDVRCSTFRICLSPKEKHKNVKHYATDYTVESVLTQYVRESPKLINDEPIVSGRMPSKKLEVVCSKCGCKMKVGHLAKKPYICQWCRVIEKKNLMRPSKEELESFISSNIPYRVLEEKYKASAQAIKKWIVHYGLKVPYRLSNNGKNLCDPEVRKKALLARKKLCEHN